MFGQFINVLVLVDLPSKDDEAIKIAIRLADRRFCVIHLLDIVKPTILSSFFGRRASGREISGVEPHRFVKDMLHMSDLKTTIEQCMPSNTVKIHICKSGHLQEAIAWYANRLCVQAIVIPEIENRGDLLLKDIAGKTHCKVFAYKDGILSMVEKRHPFGECFQCGDVRQKAADMEYCFSEN